MGVSYALLLFIPLATAFGLLLALKWFLSESYINVLSQ